VFAVSALVGLRASASLVVRLERLGERAGFTEAMLGLVAALCADAPEITASVTALVRGQRDVGAGVVLGSNVFNLAALLGLGAMVAGRVALHRRVVVFDGAVAVWMAAVTLAALLGGVSAGVGLLLVLVVFVPYVAVSAAPRRAARLRLPRSWRNFLVRAVREEEAERSGAPRAPAGGRRDAVVAALALLVVVLASVGMEATGTALGARYGVPDIVVGGIVLAAVTSMPNAVAAVFLARRGRASATLSEAFNSNTLNVLAGLLIPAVIIATPSLGGALRIAVWYGVLTVATIVLALAGRGINRRSGALIIASYLVFAVTVIAKAIR